MSAQVQQLARGRRNAPPVLNNADAERAVLGLLLADSRNWFEVADRIDEKDFSSLPHQQIFAGMAALAKAGRPLVRQMLLAQIGDWSADSDTWLGDYLTKLRDDIPRGAAINDLADAILHCSGRRKLVKAAEAINDRAMTVAIDTPLEDVRAEAMELIEASGGNPVGDAVKVGDLFATIITAANDNFRNGRPAGLMTGLRSFDDLVGPLLPGRLIVLGGETGAGKTALATQLGVLVAEQGIPVDMTSLEMEGAEVATRILASRTGVASDRIETGALHSTDLDRLMAIGSTPLIDLPFYINSKPAQPALGIQARLARMQARYGIQLSIIDHLQYIATANPKAREHEQVRDSVDRIKAMAKRLGIPVILISHVSRASEPELIKTAAEIRRPMLSALYGSSAIEKAADAVLFVHRPEWFLERSEPDPTARHRNQWMADSDRWRGRAELVLPKRRSGQGFGARECGFDARLTWFSDR